MSRVSKKMQCPIFKMGVMLFLLGLFAVGCSSDKDLQRINREQSATIQSLNGEIARLNHELDSLLKSREEQAKAPASENTAQARRRYIK